MSQGPRGASKCSSIPACYLSSADRNSTDQDHCAELRARDRGDLESTKKRGPKVRPPDERDRTIADLERELRRQKARADRAEALVELQKKVAELINLANTEQNEMSR